MREKLGEIFELEWEKEKNIARTSYQCIAVFGEVEDFGRLIKTNVGGDVGIMW